MVRLFQRQSFLIFLILIISCEKRSGNSVDQCSQIAIITSNGYQITATSASIYGYILNDEGCRITETGVCWSTSPSPTISDNSIVKIRDNNFSFRITGLVPNTLYTTRVLIKNEAGAIIYGTPESFKTLDVKPPMFKNNLIYDSLFDTDDNSYKTIAIGNQVWMAENLRTSRFNDGISIMVVNNMADWINLVQPAYCFYEFNPSVYKSVYGALYNWYSVNTGKLCPTGWHVPDLNEWNELITFLGGENIAGGKLKETGTRHWMGYTMETSNVTGFTALPGANLHGEGGFMQLGESALFWSSTADTSWLSQPGYAFGFGLYSASNKLYVGNLYMPHGLSVRCIKDAH